MFKRVKMEIELKTKIKGGKHAIKQLCELLEKIGYDVKLTFEYGSLVNSGLKAKIVYNKND